MTTKTAPGLTLAHDGVHWGGTFWVLLEALFKDLLPEGSVEATVRYTNDSGDVTDMSGTVVAIRDTTFADPACIVFKDGTLVDLAAVLSVIIA